jgi:hypothetical protein
MTFDLRSRSKPLAVLCTGLLAVQMSGVAGSALAQSASLESSQRTLSSQSNRPALEPDSALSADVDPTAADASDDAAAETDADNTSATGTTSVSTSSTSGIDTPSDILDQEQMQELRRQNMRESAVDELRTQLNDTRNDAQGVRVGSFILRPSLTETLGTERTTTAGDPDTRTFLRSGLKGTMTSDWSLHQLKIEGEGSWEKTLSGDTQNDPEGKIDAELRLDLTDETTATLKAGYSLQREDIGDPNAVANATTQSDVDQYTASAELKRDLGVLRTTAAVELTRQTYTDAILANGDRLSQADRDNNTATLRGRIGYELSPALIPFLEASYGRTLYDTRQDSLGYVRDATLYGAKAGVEVDLGEKLKGELAGGYLVAEFDDAALKSISAATIDGNATWSPRRGTDIGFNLSTEIEPTTTAGASGSTAYIGTVVLSQAILENLTGQVSSGLTLRNYSQETTPMQTVLSLGTGLTWGISRSLDFNADVAWEKTEQDGTEPYDVLRAGIGLTLKR